MCGIVGYIGQHPAAERVLAGLARLEYRGYDSAGVAYQASDRLVVAKRRGRLTDFAPALAAPGAGSRAAIAHTRWATHGEPSDRNAHPHADCSGRLAVVHNGIIENWRALRSALEAEGHKFASETDTEVLAHLLERHLWNGSAGDLALALRRALGQVEGSFAVAVLSAAHPDLLVAARRGSPLVLGIGRGEHYLASDIPALLPFTRDEVMLEDDEIALITRDRFEIQKLRSGAPTARAALRIEWDAAQAEKGGFKHYMLKEIHDQPAALEACLAGRLRGSEADLALGLSVRQARELRQVHLVACGTSRHAALVGARLFERLAGLPCQVDIASEYRYRETSFVGPETLGVVVSQSGETADTLAALALLRERRAPTLGVCNVVGSQIARLSDRTLYVHAGPEISVASTKAFTTQLAALALVALELGRLRDAGPAAERAAAVRALAEAPEQMARALPALAAEAERLGAVLAGSPLALYIGRGAGYALALEGALKLKEIAYVPAEGCAAGELKHGPIALVEPGLPVVAVVQDGLLGQKLLANVDEVRARGGRILAVCRGDDEEARARATDRLLVPTTDAVAGPMLAALPLQLLAYYAACAAGHDVDRPRNLAKSVTVE